MKMITTTAALELLGIGYKTLSELKVEPELDRTQRGRPKKLYDSSKLLRAYADYKQPEQGSENGLIILEDGTTIDPEQEKARLVKANRVAVELSTDKLRATYADKKLLQAAASEFGDNIIKTIDTIIPNIKASGFFDQIPEKDREPIMMLIIREIKKAKAPVLEMQNIDFDAYE